MIPLKDCQKGGLYKVQARNLIEGVFDGNHGFVGLREKFNYWYLDTEYHAELNNGLATVKPTELIEIINFEPNEKNELLFKYLKDRWNLT